MSSGLPLPAIWFSAGDGMSSYQGRMNLRTIMQLSAPPVLTTPLKLQAICSLSLRGSFFFLII